MLPRPAEPFKGKTARTIKDSTSDFPKGIEAPAGAPNVIIILTDDVGFGASSTFGGPIDTPNFQRLADAGLRYNTFHTTALCSPTRAALITQLHGTCWYRERQGDAVSLHFQDSEGGNSTFRDVGNRISRPLP